MTTIRPSYFGDYIDLGPLPADSIIVAVSEPGGRTPRLLLLPHQLYVELARKLLADGDGSRRIEVMPIRSEHWIDVTALVADEIPA